MNEGVIPNCYSKYSKLVGFEPNKTEYKKLLTNTTEAEKAGANLSGFKKTKYFDSALWSNQEIRELFITQGDGAVTLMGEPLKEIAENMFLNSSKKSYFKEHVQVKRKEKIACDRLDNLIKGENKIDILKVDVEGAEYDIIEDLLASSVAHWLNELHVEFHSRRFKEDKKPQEIRLIGELFQQGVACFPRI